MIRRGAHISECGLYRYTLTRQWEPAGKLLVVCGLNPSTADGLKDDATVRREVNYAKAWGFGRYVKVNAYGLRSTDPKGLWLVDDPVGPLNMEAIEEWACNADMFLAAWGNNIREGQAFRLRTRLRQLNIKVHALQLTKQGQPQHPLRLAKTLKPFLWIQGDK